jgi:hypothetical protein
MKNLLLLLLLCSLSLLAHAQTDVPQVNAARYDADYPTLGYSNRASHNAFARLQQRLEKGELQLKWRTDRGYLDDLLAALKIDTSSQVLVYSKTSLQIDGITAATPRAVYFNDQAYVGFVQGMPLLELAAPDDELGMVFYTLVNRLPGAVRIDREASRCLTCHDTYSMLGGGVPRIMVLSAVVDSEYSPGTRETSEETNDQTPLRERWGGWFVSGQTGSQLHLGNLPISGEANLAALSDAQRMNLQTLDGLLDTKPYISNKSDVVALMVLEHQTIVQNLITRASIKLRTALPRLEGGQIPKSADALSARGQTTLQALLEPLLRQMLFVDAVQFSQPIRGSAGFEQAFEARGPHDAQGRSLRQLDLKTALFRWPVSFFIYAPAFDSLPQLAREYVYGRLLQVLQGRDAKLTLDRYSAADRAATIELLQATKPEFAAYVARMRAMTMTPATTSTVPSNCQRLGLSPSSSAPINSEAGGPTVPASAPRTAPMRLMPSACNSVGRNKHSTDRASNSNQLWADTASTAVRGWLNR